MRRKDIYRAASSGRDIGGSVGRCDIMSLGEAISRRHDDDAHILPYVIELVASEGRILAQRTAVDLMRSSSWPSHARAWLTCVPIDHDGTGHRRDTSDAGMLDRQLGMVQHALAACGMSGAAVYATRGGWRAIAILEEPILISGTGDDSTYGLAHADAATARIHDAIAAYAMAYSPAEWEAAGLKPTPDILPCVQAHRLPRVVRDGQGGAHEPEWYIADPEGTVTLPPLREDCGAVEKKRRLDAEQAAALERARARQAAQSADPADAAERRIGRAQAKLRAACEELMTAVRGSRHATMCRVSTRMGGYAHYLGAEQIEMELLAAAQAAGVSPRDASRTIKSGIRLGARSPREISLPEEDAARLARRARRARHAAPRAPRVASPTRWEDATDEDLAAVARLISLPGLLAGSEPISDCAGKVAQYLISEGSFTHDVARRIVATMRAVECPDTPAGREAAWRSACADIVHAVRHQHESPETASSGIAAPYVPWRPVCTCPTPAFVWQRQTKGVSIRTRALRPACHRISCEACRHDILLAWYLPVARDLETRPSRVHVYTTPLPDDPESARIADLQHMAAFRERVRSCAEAGGYQVSWLHVRQPATEDAPGQCIIMTDAPVSMGRHADAWTLDVLASETALETVWGFLELAGRLVGEIGGTGKWRGHASSGGRWRRAPERQDIPGEWRCLPGGARSDAEIAEVLDAHGIAHTVRYAVLHDGDVLPSISWTCTDADVCRRIDEALGIWDRQRLIPVPPRMAIPGFP